jgi:hypothetical protein
MEPGVRCDARAVRGTALLIVRGGGRRLKRYPHHDEPTAWKPERSTRHDPRRLGHQPFKRSVELSVAVLFLLR